jgi:hypothetical protein
MKDVDLVRQTAGQHVKDYVRQTHKKETVKLPQKDICAIVLVNSGAILQVNITVKSQENYCVHNQENKKKTVFSMVKKIVFSLGKSSVKYQVKLFVLQMVKNIVLILVTKAVLCILKKDVKQQDRSIVIFLESLCVAIRQKITYVKDQEKKVVYLQVKLTVDSLENHYVQQ